MVQNKVCAILNLTENDNDLYPLTKQRPIAMLPFACRYRLLDFALSSITYANMRSAALFIGRSGRSVYDHIRSGKPWDLDTYRGGIFTFSQMEHKQALYEAASRRGDFYDDHETFINRSHADYVYVAGSRVLANVVISNLIEALEDSDADIARLYARVPREMIEYHPNERLVSLDEAGYINDLQVEGVTPIESDTVLYDMNMSIVPTKIMLEIIEKAESQDINQNLDDILIQFLPDYKTVGVEHHGYIANIDSINAYYQASMDMLEAEAYTELFQNKQSIYTKGHNGVPTFYAKGADVKHSQLATGCEIFGKVFHSQLFRKVVVEAEAEVSHSIILQGCKIGKGAKVSYAILDKNVTVEPGAVIEGKPDDLIVIGKHEVIKRSDF
ncbi:MULTISPECIES: glucose-1-phosphate adenylyltransferase subunit GlgD [Aerococcus]|uniref:glucose-1-phosphate adenylyltransferase subunit GlgD n=3 Tax=Aerococcus TaxID=1375 RepID=UPI000200E74E|nr:glucose-1-phosphate adenylyltransferase subunit GlgD [Aerococcus sp. Group 1]AEA01592.1 glucose-1-phosphate adenylyltransferase, GlgD subunit [Aerococcus sp. Group 1]MCY3061369.1 glucose-1-phosphate adenylyltransferase subunit GlgD [Aerococcus sp. Group 1]